MAVARVDRRERSRWRAIDASVGVNRAVGLLRARTGGPGSFALTAPAPAGPVTIFLILHTFSAGCTALTGVESISNGVPIFKSPESNIRIKASAKRPPPNAIIQPNFKFEDMGIGGLDSEFGAIFRRAFASRIFPTGLVEKLGIQHVRGSPLRDYG